MADVTKIDAGDVGVSDRPEADTPVVTDVTDAGTTPATPRLTGGFISSAVVGSQRLSGGFVWQGNVSSTRLEGWLR